MDERFPIHSIKNLKLLLCEGEQEVVSDNIPANSFYSFTNVTDKEYTVGIHADVGVAADIRVVVYDGKDIEPYTK